MMFVSLQRGTALAFLVAITGHFMWAATYYFRNGGDLGATWCDGFGFLCILYFFVVLGYLYHYVWCACVKQPCCSQLLNRIAKPVCSVFERRLHQWILFVAIIAAMAAYVIYDAWEDHNRLVSGGGLVVFLAFGYLASNNRSQINWQTIISGLVLQFLLGLLTLRWATGRVALQCAGDKVTTFLDYTTGGAHFVYGGVLVDEWKILAFKALSTLYFLGLLVNVLFHLGVMQQIVLGIGRVLHVAMGTSICESVNAAANVFLGMSEAPLLLAPYLQHLTASELHAVMASGFASVSGPLLAAYIDFGANAAHLMTASLLAAPAGLLYSKLLFPEVERTLDAHEIGVVKSQYSSVLDAATRGACQATHIVLAIVANLIAFIATVHFANGVLGWLGALVGYAPHTEHAWSVELLAGYVFMPVSFLLGVPWAECHTVGRLIGVRTMVNEFAAFQQLQAASVAPRTRAIATIALCNFANPGSIGVIIAALSALAPDKAPLVTRHVMRAFVAGMCVSFVTACIAGMLIASDARKGHRL